MLPARQRCIAPLPPAAAPGLRPLSAGRQRRRSSTSFGLPSLDSQHQCHRPHCRRRRARARASASPLAPPPASIDRRIGRQQRSYQPPPYYIYINTTTNDDDDDDIHHGKQPLIISAGFLSIRSIVAYPDHRRLSSAWSSPVDPVFIPIRSGHYHLTHHPDSPGLIDQSTPPSSHRTIAHLLSAGLTCPSGPSVTLPISPSGTRVSGSIVLAS